MTIQPAVSLKGKLQVPGDKSISHRSVMLGAISEGVTEAENFLAGADCLSTISCFQQMGVRILREGTRVRIYGKGLHGLTKPEDVLDAGNSGTTVRLLSGILSGQEFSSEITGDDSIRRRPMNRVIRPLTMMGADVRARYENSCAPLIITGRPLTGISYQSPVASAQVKSCVLLAGLYADGPTSVTEPALSRDHTERMLRYFGADLTSSGTTASLLPGRPLCGSGIRVPGDISSAAYFIAAASLIPGSEIILENVGINPTRDGFLRAAAQMGADIQILREYSDGPEPAADLLVRSARLHGTTIEGDLIPALIDEIPMLAVMGAFAEGTTVIRDASELKVKESYRIATITENLLAMGADVTPAEDGLTIRGGAPLKGCVIDPHMDHRIAMSFAVAALAADGESRLLQKDCVSISYPMFFRDLSALAGS